MRASRSFTTAMRLVTGILVLLLAAGLAAAQVSTLLQITDAHLGRSLSYEPPDKGPWAEVVRGIVADCNEVIRPAAVVVTGDLVSAPGEADLAAYKETLSGLQAPLLNCPGNHDLSGKDAVALFTANVGPLHQARLVGGAYLACINTFSFLGAADPTAELRWLQASLATREARNARVRIVCGHYPLYEDETRQTSGIFARADFQILGASREALIHVLRLGQAELYLSGHVHSNWDEVCLVSGTRQLVTAAACEGNYRVIVLDGARIGTRSCGVHGWPLVVITQPAAYVRGGCAVSRGSATVRAKVFAPAEVRQVSCSLEGGTPVALAATAEGMWQASLDISQTPVGLRKLQVKATSVDGREGQSEIQFVVSR